MRAFYEHFDHKRLADRAQASGFPTSIMKLALAAYRGPRYVTQDGKIGAALKAASAQKATEPNGGLLFLGGG